MEGSITIKHMQNYIAKKDLHLEKERDSLLKLMEEVGELAQAVIRHFPNATDDNIKGTIDEEVYDVLFYILAIANEYNVDLEKCVPLKEKYTDAKWNTNYFDGFYE